jgi:hypothetical protein
LFVGAVDDQDCVESEMSAMSTKEMGICLILAAGVGAFALSLYEYLTPLTGINGSFGALLVCAASLALVVDGICLGVSKGRRARLLWLVLGLLGIIGTFVAGYFLHLPVLMGLMVAVMIGVALNLGRRAA